MPRQRHSHERTRRHEIRNVTSAPVAPRHSGPVRRKTPRHATKLEPAPTPKSMESDELYERRIRHGTYAEEGIRRRRRKKALVVLVIALVAVALAAAAGVYSYLRNTDARLQLPGPEVEALLVDAQPGQPCYVLCVADFADRRYSYDKPSNDAYMLARIDEQARTVTLVTIPSEIGMEFPDDGYYSLADYPRELGEDAAVYAVSKFAGVPISHYVRTDAARVAVMCDLVGGVTMDVTHEIDDPEAGSTVVKPGEHQLDGEEALVVLRATNVAGGFEATAAYRMTFTTLLLRKALDSTGIGFAGIVSDASRYIDTDWTASELLSLGDAFRPGDSITFYQCIVPYTKTASAKDGSPVYRCIESDWRTLMEAVSQGRDPASTEREIGEVNQKEVSVEVRNGAQINGAAGNLGNMLSELGYNVLSVGNVDDGTMYPETLVVYTREELEDAALSIVRDIGAGRVVNGGDFYSSNADVIVIIGVDWST